MWRNLKFGSACLITPRPDSGPLQALQLLNADFFLYLGKRNACVMTDPGLAWLAGAINILQPLVVLLEEILYIPTPSHTAPNRPCDQSRSCSSRPNATINEEQH